MSIYIPYFYIIQDIRNGVYYAGAKWGRDADPARFMTENGYTTSSSIVNKIIETHGFDIFTTQKIKTFTTKKDVISYEKKFLQKVDAKNNPRFYNRQNNDHLFSYHDDRYKEKMLEMYGVEYPLKSTELQIRQQQNNKEKYGVGNVFQADFVKNIIKETNLERYGVQHPSYSKELLEKKAQNNMEKYGVADTRQLPHIKEKAIIALKSQKVIDKRRETFLKKYGVDNAAQVAPIMESILETRKTLSNRSVVKLLREYTRYFKIKLGEGWYQSSDERLGSILSDIQIKHGYYTYDEISVMQPEKKYSNSIKRLQSRQVVKEIWKYKEKYGHEIKIGRAWDRKSDDHLESVLSDLIAKYGPM